MADRLPFRAIRTDSRLCLKDFSGGVRSNLVLHCMSSTNRHARPTTCPDYYRTPVPAILDFFDALEADWREILDPAGFSFDQPFSVLDPCAGGDAVHDMSYPVALRRHRLWRNMRRLVTVDIRPDSRAEFKADYLSFSVAEVSPMVVLTNPPFNLAQPVIEKALSDVADGGLVIALLRLNYLGAQKRADFFGRHMPSAIFVHSKRMSFSDAPGTDSAEYAHFIWQRGKSPRFSLIRRVESKLVRTPSAVPRHLDGVQPN